jgi:hypothetical protein
VILVGGLPTKGPLALERISGTTQQPQNDNARPSDHGIAMKNARTNQSISNTKNVQVAQVDTTHVAGQITIGDIGDNHTIHITGDSQRGHATIGNTEKGEESDGTISDITGQVTIGDSNTTRLPGEVVGVNESQASPVKSGQEGRVAISTNQERRVTQAIGNGDQNALFGIGIIPARIPDAVFQKATIRGSVIDAECPSKLNTSPGAKLHERSECPW